MEQTVETLRQWVQQARSLVFFGGAGVSTESGISDFRGVDGLYSQQFDVPPGVVISHTFFERKPETFAAFTGRKCCLWRPFPRRTC